MKNKFNCTGCTACSYICPHNAITMEEDNEGFIFPKINNDRCIQCGLCDLICEKNVEYASPIELLCVQNNDLNALKKATSGGCIVAIADYILKKRGCIFAVQYLSVSEGPKWSIVEKKEQLCSIQGSKYFQVPLSREVINTINSRCKKQIVLFVGTPCQVSAVKKIIKSPNLITIDLICGGIASYKLEKAYINYWHKKENKKVYSHIFRSKNHGWTKDYVGQVIFDDGTVIEKTGFADLFNRLYNSGNCNRESCYNCEFTRLERVGDFTAGDAWGIEDTAAEQLYIKKGVSLLLVNTNIAKDILNNMDSIKYISASPNVILNNKPLREHNKRRAIRSVSYFIIDNFNLKFAANVINYRYVIKKIVRKIK